jgi:hypothetical protein
MIDYFQSRTGNCADVTVIKVFHRIFQFDGISTDGEFMHRKVSRIDPDRLTQAKISG